MVLQWRLTNPEMARQNDDTLNDQCEKDENRNGGQP